MHLFKMSHQIYVGLVVTLSFVTQANAHFIYATFGKHADKPEARLYFSESAHVNAERMPDKIAAAKFWGRTTDGKVIKLQGSKSERDDQPQLVAALPSDASCSIEASCAYGVYQNFLLTYYAKHLHVASIDELKEWTRSDKLDLDVAVQSQGSELVLTVLWKGKPVEDANVLLIDAEENDIEKTTNADGQIGFNISKSGLHAARVHYVDKSTSGELDGKEYKSAQYYATLTIDIPSKQSTKKVAVAELPEALASFGAVVCDDWLYVYSGHIGKAHDHSIDNLSKHFRRMHLQTSKWETLPMQTPVQGLALVAHRGSVYRIGGMTAKNSSEDEADLHSTSDFAKFDPKSKTWTNLASLPAGRSSHDAVVINDKIYVAGGWALAGEDEGDWHSSTLEFDLQNPGGQWKAIAEQPFQRRALATSHFANCLYVIGGMNADHDIDRSVNMFDFQQNKWKKGPELPGEGMNGFGVSAWNDGKNLYVSGSNGIVYRLNEKNNSWDEAEKLAVPRFFHQLVPSKDSILAVGGASMRQGHLKSIERLQLAKKTETQPVAR